MILEVPTTLSEERNSYFRKLYKKQYNIVLTEQESNEEAFRMLTFLAVIIEHKTKSV